MPKAATGRILSSKWRRPVVFAGAALLLGLAYRHYWLEHPVGTGPAGPPVPREAFSSPWSTRKVLLVGIGDSVTAGYGATPGCGYFDRLVKNSQGDSADVQGITLSSVLPNLTARNLALSGANTRECLEILVPKIDRHSDDTLGLVVMTIGGNDIIHNYGRTPPREGAMYGATLAEARPWIDNFQSRLEEILDGIATNFPGGCEFFLANIYDPTDGIGDAVNAGLPAWPEGLQIIAAYNRVIADIAKARGNVHLVDMHGAFLGHGVHCLQFWREHYCAVDPHYWYWDNLEDPNDRGYDALRRLFLIEISRVLPQKLAAAGRGTQR